MNNYEPYINRILRSESIDNELVDYINTSKSRYLYGGGLQTAVCIGIFRDIGIDIKGIILPAGGEQKELKGYWRRLMRQTKKYSISELSIDERRNAYVMMTIPRTEYEIVKSFLESNDIAKIMGCCWEHNSELNDICYDVWYQKVRTK